MILTHRNRWHSGTKTIFARSHVCARTCRRSSPILIVYRRRSAPGWLGNDNQKPSPLRSRMVAFERGTHDQQAEAIGRTQSPISIARSLRTVSLSCSSIYTPCAVGARARHSICTFGESNESSHTFNKKRTFRRRFADLLAADGRVEPSATTKPPTFDGRRTFECAFSNTLWGVLSNRVGGPT
jgi:hypothetical protein